MARRGGKRKRTTRRSSISTRRSTPGQDESDADDRESKIPRISIPEVPDCLLFAVLRAVPSPFVRMLTSRDACKLLISCSRGVAQDVRDAIGNNAFPLYYEGEDVHLIHKCYGDWHQVVPAHISTKCSDCTCPRYDLQYRSLISSSTWSLPRSPRARTHLLEAVHLVYRGIRQHCFKTMRIPTTTMRKRPSWLSWTAVPVGTMQPVAFSLARAMEVDRQKGSEVLTNYTEGINVDNVDELARLMNIVEPELGFRYFSTRNNKLTREPTNVFEAHWRGIEVDAVSGKTTCLYCENYEESYLFTRILNGLSGETFTAYCTDVYQPLKKFMLQHLEHVRYVRPPRGWNENDKSVYGFKRPFMDLVAGFTSAGVLVGVHLVAPDVPL